MGGAQSCQSAILRVAATLVDTSEKVHAHIRIRVGPEDVRPACIQSKHRLAQGNAGRSTSASGPGWGWRDIHGGGVDEGIHQDQAGDLYRELGSALDFILFVSSDLALLHLLAFANILHVGVESSHCLLGCLLRGLSSPHQLSLQFGDLPPEQFNLLL